MCERERERERGREMGREKNGRVHAKVVSGAIKMDGPSEEGKKEARLTQLPSTHRAWATTSNIKTPAHPHTHSKWLETRSALGRRSKVDLDPACCRAPIL